MKFTRLTLIAVCAAGLVACAGNKDPLQYRTAGAKKVGLEVPPDLTTPKNENRYTIPGSGSATANETSTSPMKTYNQTVLANTDNMRVERDGLQRWLVIDGKEPSDVWPILKIFWQEMGFVIKSEEPEVGLMETDWAENRAKLPNDGLRNLLDKVGIGSVYSSPERDKFVIRLERTDKGTEVFFTHKGLSEAYADNKKTSTKWQPRPSDPELEAVFLGRFMVRLGMNEEKVKQQVSENQPVQAERVRVIDSELILDDAFDRAWRRVGLALDRIGLTVTDRNRTEGIYFVKVAQRESDVLTEEKKPGMFKRMFGSKSEAKKNKAIEGKEFVIRLNRIANDKTSVILLDDTGSKMTSAEAKDALIRLHSELR